MFIALSIFDAQTLSPGGQVCDESKMLLGIRNASTNVTHPDVLSTPTMRLRDVFVPELLATHIARSTMYHNDDVMIMYVVSNLLALKLGVADELVLGSLHYSAHLALVVNGRVEHHDGEVENNRMINLRVNVDQGANLIPPHTASYSKLMWVSVYDFKKMWPGRDVTQVGIMGAEALRVCTTGLCMASSYEYICQMTGS